MEIKKEEVCGIEQEIHYDKEIMRLNLELVSVMLPDEEPYYEIHFQDWKKDGKCKTILKLHIKEALELKSIIDQLVYDATTQN